jgi:hypothetical protein
MMSSRLPGMVERDQGSIRQAIEFTAPARC